MSRTVSPRLLINVTSWGVWALLLASYWVTTPRTVSYWDCPEYVTAAALLEVGHPPGNPVWMLVERVVTMFAGSPETIAYAVNLSSGVFTAFAGFFLARIIFTVVFWISGRLRRGRWMPPEWGAAGASAIGALAFGWCDSAWYSAVEAEVYAMSIFLTALCIWLMVKWAFTTDARTGNRLLVLLAYIFGLSIGVHQLNLLCIPALALMWSLRRGVRSPLKLCVIIILGMLAVACVLVGMMPSTIEIAARLEILCVNTLGLPHLAGVIVYLLLLGLSLIGVLIVTARSTNRGVVAAVAFPTIFLSGIFSLGGNMAVGAAVAALMTLLLVRPNHFDVRRLNLAFWMLTMLLVGYGAYALIPVRGDAAYPINPTMPGNPFSFAAYQAREQYSANPLIYGPTPYSRPMFQEEWEPGAAMPTYSRYALMRLNARTVPYEPGARFADTPGLLTHEDSAVNLRGMDPDRPGYVVKGHKLRNIMTPELNVWFPRISSRDPLDIRSYYDWVGMDTSNMTKVNISEAFDTLGMPVGRMITPGHREKTISYRPTFIQNMAYLGTYQISYMYLRYLLWNFCGRQNDIPSQGEVEHGNFITGFGLIDNAMLGAEDNLPEEAGKGNKGRNRYFMVPLLLGLFGLVSLFCLNRRSRAVGGITLLLFFMTGMAIVIYLNQSPGEPRERDYSFLGSFWTFGLWIGAGAFALARLCRNYYVLLIGALVPVYMFAENFDDHDRRGRNVAVTLAKATLESLEPDAILFVDGDNLTFPLWYAQEVEGIRRDVRVVNISYLTIPSYAGNIMRPWRDSKAVSTTLSRGDIIYDALSNIRISGYRGDTLPAAELIMKLKKSDKAATEAEYVTLPGLEERVATIPVRNLSLSGKDRNIPMRAMLMLDVASTALAQDSGRPVYWSNALASASSLRLDSAAFTETLYARRLGHIPDSLRIGLLANGINMTGFSTDHSREVYMDAAPAKMTGNARKCLVLAGGRLLSEGRLELAEKALDKADIGLGNNSASYPFIKEGERLVNIREVLGRLQIALADSLASRAERDKSREVYLKSRAIELKSRGGYNIRQNRKRLDEWSKYRRALPDRLKPMTVPLS